MFQHLQSSQLLIQLFFPPPSLLLLSFQSPSLCLTSKYFYSPLFEAAMGLLTSSTNHFSCLRGAHSPMEVWKYDPHHLLLVFVFLGAVSDGPITSDPQRDRRSGPWVGRTGDLAVFSVYFNLSPTGVSLSPGREIRNIQTATLGFRISFRIYTH